VSQAPETTPKWFAMLRHWLLRPVLLLALDGAIAAFSFWLAMLLRFEGSITETYSATLPAFALLLVSQRILTNVSFRIHHWSFRFSGLTDAARVAAAALAGTGVFLGTIYFLRLSGPPRSVVVLELLLTTLGMLAIRFAPRLATTYVSDWVRTQKPSSLRTVIVGAGSAGEMLLRDLRRIQKHDYLVLGFVDDDPAKQRLIVGGKSVLGTTHELGELARKHRVGQVLIAIAHLDGRRVREILSVCADQNIRFKILPVSFLEHDRQDVAAFMQDLTPEDLLPRDPVVFEDTPELQGRNVLVTGAAGSIGSEICVQLAASGVNELTLVDMNENGMYMLSHRLARERPDTKVLIEVADIRDPRRMLTLLQRHRPHDVFHAAAHKHVPLMEAAPCEAVKNNILGTRNVAEAAHAAEAERFIYISTDKAVRPSSVMGTCKRVGEFIVRELAERSMTRFCAVRFGNVLGSAGSVVSIFREQIAAGGPVQVTHLDVRRFFMTIPEAVALVLKAGYSEHGELCVLDMGEQLRIDELARNMITMSGFVPEVDIAIEYTGLRPGEKLYEELLTEEEEETRAVNHKILVATCPPPCADLLKQVGELAEAAAMEDENRVLRLLCQLVPSYTHFDGLEAGLTDRSPDVALERS
jgi:FlaA1/EpsC-like NDP-sugar epimerase